jgi:molecular chaperone DnaJ
MKDYYKILQVSKTATMAEIKKSYRNLAKKYHPDANKDDPKAKEIFQDIGDAYNTLGDEEKRKVYDQKIGGTNEPEASQSSTSHNTSNTKGENKNYRDINFNDISSMNSAFESFFGFDPKSKEVNLNNKNNTNNGGAMKTEDLFRKFFGDR